MKPIGVVRTPFMEKASAPRQPAAAGGARGRIEIAEEAGYDDALDGLAVWSHIWVIFLFHENEGAWRPKVLPPRSQGKRIGLFATRSPHRPNPIGLSVVRLLGVTGRVLDVEGVDMIDGTPVLDLKPYVAYTDAIVDASSGWLVADPGRAYEIIWSPIARAQADWLAEHGIDLAADVTRTLSLGPQPHAYRRIRRDGDGMRLAMKEWRVRFTAEGDTITIAGIFSGFRARDLATGGSELDVHRAFVARFPTSF